MAKPKQGGKTTPKPDKTKSKNKSKLLNILKIEKLLKLFYLYLSIVGLFSFSLFIQEESAQQITFSNFVNSDTHRYDLMLQNNIKLNKIADSMSIINKCFLWMQPFQCVAYGDYIESIRLYTQSIQALILAKDPGLFVNYKYPIDFKFYYQEVSYSNQNIRLKSGKLFIDLPDRPNHNPIDINQARLQQISQNLYEIKI